MADGSLVELRAIGGMWELLRLVGPYVWTAVLVAVMLAWVFNICGARRW
jgi:hypothetical protein